MLWVALAVVVVSFIALKVLQASTERQLGPQRHLTASDWERMSDETRAELEGRGLDELGSVSRATSAGVLLAYAGMIAGLALAVVALVV